MITRTSEQPPDMNYFVRQHALAGRDCATSDAACMAFFPALEWSTDSTLFFGARVIPDIGHDPVFFVRIMWKDAPLCMLIQSNTYHDKFENVLNYQGLWVRQWKYWDLSYRVIDNSTDYMQPKQEYAPHRYLIGGDREYRKFELPRFCRDMATIASCIKEGYYYSTTLAALRCYATKSPFERETYPRPGSVVYYVEPIEPYVDKS